MGYKAIVAGASGLVGSKLVETLLSASEYSAVTVLVRKCLTINNAKLTQVVVDFNHLENYAAEINGHALFCCLGSTRKKTPDLEQYKKVDHYYPLTLERIAATNGVSQFHLVSSLGAKSSSSNFYTKMKGETEHTVKQVAIKAIMIYQPSFLTGERQEKRPLEKFASGLAKLINPLLIGRLRKYRSILAQTVAAAMYKRSLIDNNGIFTYPSDKIKNLV